MSNKPKFYQIGDNKIKNRIIILFAFLSLFVFYLFTPIINLVDLRLKKDKREYIYTCLDFYSDLNGMFWICMNILIWGEK